MLARGPNFSIFGSLAYALSLALRTLLPHWAQSLHAMASVAIKKQRGRG
jgi:hypothetical protein